MENHNENIIPTESSINKYSLDNKIVVVHHVDSNLIEGNMKYVSIHQILCQIYDKLFNLNINFTKSHSYQNCNILIESLPIISYGVNLVNRSNINLFLKKLTGIDKNFSKNVNESSKSAAHDLERIIFTDLQLFINVYNYYASTSSTPFWKKFFKFLYQPKDSIKTYLKDREVMKEVRRVFDITDIAEVIIIY
jgi:hypothetical protein